MVVFLPWQKLQEAFGAIVVNANHHALLLLLLLRRNLKLDAGQVKPQPRALQVHEVANFCNAICSCA